MDMQPIPPLLLLLLLLHPLIFAAQPQPPPPPPPPRHQSHLTKSPFSRQSRKATTPQEYIELTRPLPFQHLTPTCSLLVLNHSFADTINQPPVTVPYSPPSNCTWSHAVLELRVSSKGDQYDRISALWLAGVEILRTSTAEPTDDGIFWKVRKGITRYSSLLSQSNLAFSVMLENIVNDVFTGVYHVNVTIFFYDAVPNVIPTTIESQKLILGPNPLIKYTSSGGRDSKIGLDGLNVGDNSPADLIIPISGNGERGFWFRIEDVSDVHSKGIQIPANTWKAVIEVYVSFHGDDEFWYSNPPDSYIISNNLTTGRAHGAYREVLVTIDGRLVGSVVPMPVVFTGGINPLFWEPVVGIGAFELPTYDFDVTPSLGLVLDGKVHQFGLGVADAISYWLVDANLHLWLDQGSQNTEADTRLNSRDSTFSIEREEKFVHLDGVFEIEVGRKTKFRGWVKSSAGNLTTQISQELKLKNLIRFQENGTRKFVKQSVKSKTKIKVESDAGKLISRVIVRGRYPLDMSTATLPSSAQNDTYLMMTSLDHGLKVSLSSREFLATLNNNQKSNGWMLVQDHSVLSGSASTNQSYSYDDSAAGCYTRTASAADGRLVQDNATFHCAQNF